jgi:hypothetical protein
MAKKMANMPNRQSIILSAYADFCLIRIFI